MNLHKLSLSILITAVILSVVGCSKGTEAPAKATQENQENTETVSQNEEIAIPEEQPALIGKVKEIVGNEVTVFKGEVGQDAGAPPGEPISEEAQDKFQAIREQMQNGTITPEQAREKLGNLGLQANQTRGNGMKFTEETETLIIPVGTPIVTRQRGADETNQVELTEIKKDTILQIWKTDDTVDFVLVMSIGGNRTPGNGEGGEGRVFPGGGGPGFGGGGGPVFFGGDDH